MIRTTCMLLATTVMIATTSSAGVPSLEELRQILEKNRTRIRSVQCEYSQHSEILYDVGDLMTEENLELKKARMSFVVERGKFYGSGEYQHIEPGAPEMRTYKEAWDGHRRFRSTTSGQAEPRNSIYSSFDWGLCRTNVDKLEAMGVPIASVFGSYDGESAEAKSTVATPYAVLNRVRMIKGEKIELSETQRDGKSFVVMTLLKTDGRRFVEHIMDPSLEFAPVQFSSYDLSGPLRYTIKREYRRDDAGYVVLAGARVETTVRMLAWRARKIAEVDKRYAGIAERYKREDYDKIGQIKYTKIKEMKVNQRIDPRVFEQENVFDATGEIWDEDRGIRIRRSAKEIEEETRKVLSDSGFRVSGTDTAGFGDSHS